MRGGAGVQGAAAPQRGQIGYPIIEGYGLTEATFASTVNPLDWVRKPGTVGVALPGQQVAAIRPDGLFAAAGERARWSSAART